MESKQLLKGLWQKGFWHIERPEKYLRTPEQIQQALANNIFVSKSVSSSSGICRCDVPVVWQPAQEESASEIQSLHHHSNLIACAVCGRATGSDTCRCIGSLVRHQALEIDPFAICITCGGALSNFMTSSRGHCNCDVPNVEQPNTEPTNPDPIPTFFSPISRPGAWDWSCYRCGHMPCTCNQ